MPDVINFTTLLLAFVSPVLVALILRQSWPDEVGFLVALAVVALIYTLGRWLDGLLTWPLGAEFAVGLAAAFGTQQLFYQATKRSRFMRNLRAFPARSPDALLLDRARRI